MRLRFDLERVIDEFVFFCFFNNIDLLSSLNDLYKELPPLWVDQGTMVKNRIREKPHGKQVM